MQRILALEMQSLQVVTQVRQEEAIHQLRQVVERMVAWPIRLQEAITIFLYLQAIQILQLQLPMPFILHSQEATHQWAMRLP